MFTVKAIVRSNVGPEPFTLLTAEKVHVAHPADGQGITPVPSFPVEREVRLFNKAGEWFETLYIGKGIDQYESVYVMNASGKTIQSIYANGVAKLSEVA